MKPNWVFGLLAGLIAIAPLMSCGSSGGYSADGGIGGTGISAGTITGFGSVFVNGVEFDTEGAEITVDGQPAAEGDLGIGMVVVVEGTFDGDGLTGTADRIIYEELVEGPVEAIDPVEETFVVLGRMVLASDETAFAGVSFEGLEIGNIVEVSGHMIAGGDIRATRVEFKAAAFVPGVTELEITGIVENLEELAMTFTIGGLAIDFSDPDLVFDNLPGGLSNGILVEVESVEGVVSGVLVASRIEGRDSFLAGFEGLRVEIEGVVTDFTSPGDFSVNGIPVRTDGNTLYENGTAADLELDTRLEVEGVLDGDGVVMAEEIEFRLDGTVEIEADVQSVDPEAGTVVLLGITVATDSLTVVWDNSDAQVQPFGLGNIQVGDRVVAIGNPEGSAVLAVRLERRNPASGVELKGPVTGIANPLIEVLGVGALTSDETEFLDSNELPISVEEFFGSVQIDSIVGVEGTFDGVEIIADEVEFVD